MKRNSTTLFLISPNATTPIRWVNGEPDFSAYTDPTLSVLTSSWNEFVASGEELEVVPDPDPVTEPVVPGWTQFNLAISQDANMLAYEAVANTIHPSIVSKKDLAYSVIDTKGLDNFAAIFPLFCDVASVTIEHREAWALMAESYHLPIDFVEVIRG